MKMGIVSPITTKGRRELTVEEKGKKKAGAIRVAGNSDKVGSTGVRLCGDHMPVLPCPVRETLRELIK